MEEWPIFKSFCYYSQGTVVWAKRTETQTVIIHRGAANAINDRLSLYVYDKTDRAWERVHTFERYFEIKDAGVGPRYVSALSSQGELFAWATCLECQEWRPLIVSHHEPIHKIAYGKNTVLAIAAKDIFTDIVYRWVVKGGKRGTYALGTLTAVLFLHFGRVVDVACGDTVCCLLTARGKIFGSFCGSDDWTCISGPPVWEIADICCGRDFGLALTRRGEVFVWGHNSLRHTTSLKNANAIETQGKRAVEIAASWEHTLGAIRYDDGRAFVWGADSVSSTGITVSPPRHVTLAHLFMERARVMLRPFCARTEHAARPPLPARRSSMAL